jgi:hypothetical protein
MEDTTCPYCGYELTKGAVYAPLENFLFLPDGLRYQGQPSLDVFL